MSAMTRLLSHRPVEASRRAWWRLPDVPRLDGVPGFFEGDPPGFFEDAFPDDPARAEPPEFFGPFAFDLGGFLGGGGEADSSFMTGRFL
ncbi:hypothetical protein [Actinomadura syzygii]|uniref:hypothetical protein n=2 Tax=Actinomadura syzygii TaxID=1427538 RepID=UPI001CA321D3|nr:hypothetical protein [Actinomadura syzygii]